MVDIEYAAERDVTFSLGDHQALLSFSSDEGAYAFWDWWYAQGHNAFVEWNADS